MFHVINVPDNAADVTEPLGSKPKFWFIDKNQTYCLFKQARVNTGDDWSEKVSAELCDLIGLPHAKYELAIWKGQRGVVTPTFVPKGESLIHGNELLYEANKNYPKTKRYIVRQHTFRNVLNIVEKDFVKLPINFKSFPGVSTAADVFIGYLMLDAWIANQDRHHENWSLVSKISQFTFLQHMTMLLALVQLNQMRIKKVG